MKEIIQEIFRKALSTEIQSFSEIKGLGIVNRIFEVKGENETYILRLNEEGMRLEYQKESWCLNKLEELNMLTPRVLADGRIQDFVYMIQTKIPGVNGSFCKSQERVKIWQQLGSYAKTFHQIQRIEEEEVEASEFHKDWKARLHYNLNELNEKDSLLQQQIFTKAEQTQAKKALSALAMKEFETGLVHGDLCPRNVMIDGETVFLLDWGTAEINVVPHMEIGILLMSEEASQEEFRMFLAGLGISPSAYSHIEKDIHLLSLLHRLDKYRWAEGQDGLDLEEFGQKVRESL